MNFFSGNCLNSVYFDVLVNAFDNDYPLADSRCGLVKDLGPTVFEFLNPGHQFLFLRGRKYNPFFAIAESAWMLSGKNTLSEMTNILTGYASYSDDQESLNGAYGFRMKSQFGVDQIEKCVSILKRDSLSRRAVITLYDPSDLDRQDSSDIPCNTTLFLKIRENKLDISVINRSNDLFLGVPYNVFAFGVIHKYIASRLDVSVGVQRHFTDSLHLYEKDIPAVKKIVEKNDSGEILRWISCYNLSDSFFGELFREPDEMSKFDMSEVTSEYFKRIIQAYKVWKECRNSTLLYNIADDALGHAVKLWIESVIGES